MAGFDLDEHIPGDARVVAGVLNKLWTLYGWEMAHLRPARHAPEKLTAFLADRRTRGELEKALIEILAALEQDRIGEQT